MNRKNRKSIRTKIMSVTLCALFTIALLTGIMSVIVVNRLAKQDSELILTEICQKEALRFDNKLNLVKHSVETIYEYAKELMETEEGDVYSDQYLERLRELAIAISEKTDGAMAVYYRYNPEYTGDGTGGFFWSKKSRQERFSEEPPTDILAYNASDVEHVGWFYVPKETGKPLWMTPYYNQNLGVYMISYVIPFYKNTGEFIGVIGMDIDFNTIMNIAGNVKIYETGKSALVDLKERVIYYSENHRSSTKKLSNTLYNHITTINKDSELLKITESDGQEALICCDKLTNGMRLYINVPLREVNAKRNQLIYVLGIITVCVFVATILIVWNVTSKIIGPIKKLALVTDQYANGAWSENYVCETADELQDLSESVAKMAGNTQKYLGKLNHLARTDGLTGINNNTAYLEKMEEIISNRHQRYDEYAIVVMDLNLLKKANDTYGHEAGDALLKEASKYICETFAHSAAFRIGGDEFVAILEGEDYQNRKALCKQFESGMGYEVKDASGVKLYVSYGMAAYPEEGNSYDALFRLADERMYAKKDEMKMGRTD